MRTYGLILLAFVAGVMVLVAAFAWQGRSAREYGRAAVQAAQQAGLTARTPDRLCADLLKRPPPGGVQKCVVKAAGGQLAAVVTLEGERTFQVGP
ncbi:hypothetical protein Dcar01_00784 [Deinococcus carri]|uniref:DUF4333 domain-containing protein n=1 Tax=Deinococcus carri TaxID=1211323 RepID=A0ABP9W3Y1_9DEIO